MIADSSGNNPPMNLTGNAGITRVDGRNGVTIATGGQLVAANHDFLFSELTLTEKFSVELWIETTNLTQGGPARIVTFSDGGSTRNFTFGQHTDTFVARLRTNISSIEGAGRPNGLGALVAAAGPNLRLQHVVWTYDGITNEIWIDGQRDSSQTLPGGFSNWDPTFQFGFGDEFTDTRQWVGHLYYAAVYNRALTPKEIEHHEELGSTANPTIAQDTSPTMVENCEEWPFDLLEPESFDLLEKAGCSIVKGNVYLQANSRTKLAKLVNVTKIEGDLIVDDVADENLDALSDLSEIGGSLILSNNENLTSFVGLSALNLIGDSLIIDNNPLVTSTLGFSNITVIPGTLNITNNPRLTSLSGFENLTAVDKALSIDLNAALKTVNFDALETAERMSISQGGVQTLVFASLISVNEFWLRSTDFLTQFPPLPADNYYFMGNRGLTSIPQLPTSQSTNVTIAYNQNLSALSTPTGTEIYNLNIRASGLSSLALDNLQRVHGTLTLYNSGLTSLNGGFQALERVDGRLLLSYNHSLQSMNSAFPLLENVGSLDLYQNTSLTKISDGFASLLAVDNLSVTYHASLPQCDIVIFRDSFSLFGTFQAHNNDELGICP